MPDALEQQQPGGGHQWPSAHEEARAEAVGERAEAPREHEHDERHRQRREAALQRRVAADLLQEQHEEEEQDREACVHRERLDVARATKLRRRNSPSGSIGVAGARLVEHERGEQRSAGERAGRSPRGSTIRAAAARSARTPVRRGRSAHSTAPGRSIRRAPLCARRSARVSTTRISATQTIDSGMLIRNIQRQDAIASSSPPASGPSTAAIAPQAVQVPIAAPRSSSANVLTITASELGTSSAPATP